VPQIEHRYEGTPLLFSAPGGRGLLVNEARKKKGEKEMTVRTIHDIVRIFGLPTSSAHKGKGWQYRGAVDLCNTVEVWWPKISPCDPDSGWRNTPQRNANGQIVEITERYVKNSSVNTTHVSDILNRMQTRLVFGKFVNKQGYTYVGRFVLDVAATQKQKACVWTLKSNQDSFDADKKLADQTVSSESR